MMTKAGWMLAASVALWAAIAVAGCDESQPQQQSEHGAAVQPSQETQQTAKQVAEQDPQTQEDAETSEQPSAEPQAEAQASDAEQDAGREQEQAQDEVEAGARDEAQADLSAEQIEWTDCGSGVECGFIAVPADYRDPEAGSIQIAVNVHRASDPALRIGYLLVNPGGPGGSGIALTFAAAEGDFSDEIVERFDIVGFDPRGVGASEPFFACGEPGEQLALLATIEEPIDTPEEIAAGEAAANLCIESMGAIGALLHSEYVARDMDEIRRALGAEQISYLGFSYGSALGVWYATLFPESVRAMVVDGADNPLDAAETQEQRVAESLEEIATFSSLLEQALNACADPECPIYNDGDPVGYFRQAVAKLHLVNEAADDHPQAGTFGVISTLYSEDYWPDLWLGLFELQQYDDPAILLDFASFQFGETPGAANIAEHVNCLDGLVLQPELDRETQLADGELANDVTDDQFPLLALLEASLASACPFYDQFAPAPLEIPFDGGGVPILVVGNHADPFSPFGESEELAVETLRNGYLVETTHRSHVVYPNNACVNEHIHRALIDRQYPQERRVICEREG